MRSVRVRGVAPITVSKQFEGQRTCIVGGTAGIGRAIARFVAGDTAKVILAGRDIARTPAVATGLHPSVVGRAIDVTQEESVATFFAEAGAVDHLVVTAAQVGGGSFREESAEDARRSFDGKFWAQWLCARHATVKRSILLFSGILSRKPSPGLTTVGAFNGATIERMIQDKANEGLFHTAGAIQRIWTIWRPM